jgi:hypothetical protein
MRWWIGLALVGCQAAPAPEQAPPPPAALTFDAPMLFPGHTTAVFAAGADPEERVHYALSTQGAGAGPCPGPLGGQCLDLPQPIYLGSRLADETGQAWLPVAVPDTAPPGLEACFQGAVVRGPGGGDSELSAAVCGLVQDPDPCLSGETVVEVGTGSSTFVPLVSGQDLEMVRGGQGGWHMPLAVRAYGLTDFITLDMNLFDMVSGESVSFGDPQSLSLPLPPIPGTTSTCDGQLTDLVAFLDFSRIGGVGGNAWQTLCGHEIRIDFTIRDYQGPGIVGPVLGGSSVYVYAQPDPGDGSFCAQVP